MVTMKHLILLLSIVLLATTQSIACNCMGEKSTVKKAVKSANVLFVGRVLTKEKIYPAKGNDKIDSILANSYYRYKYTLQVITLYKGKRGTQTIEVVSGKGSGDCGYLFEEGETYIVYANTTKYKINNKNIGTYLTTDICTRTCKNQYEEIAAIEMTTRPKNR